MEKKINISLNNNLNKYLRYYFSLENPQFAILINGKWGSGKTFFIKNQINQWNNTKTTNIAGEIVLKPIFISLYGLRNFNEINSKIKEALNPLLYSKGAKILKNIFIGAVKTATHIDLDANGDGESDGKISFDINLLNILKDSDKNIKGNKIIIFDDLERCSIQIDELFGYINEFVEHYNCKVILLSDEEKIYKKHSDKNNSYKDFKEKLIGQTFTIESDIDNAIYSFINKSSNIKTTTFLNHSKELIKSIFVASQIENLRILKQAILDFGRFTSQFDISFLKNKNYSNFLNSLLGHFLLVYLEYKSGNQKISDIGRFNFSEEIKELESSINAKYSEILYKYGVLHRRAVIEYSYICEFIIDGYSNTRELDNSLKANEFFRKSEIHDWEKLWYWENLEDEEFDNVYKRVKYDFSNSKISNPYILAHIVGIFLSLIRTKIINEDKKTILNLYKSQFTKILSNNKSEVFMKFGNYSWNKSFREYDSVEFTELVNFSNKKISVHNSENKDEYLKTIFENLNDESINDLQEKLDKRLPDRSTSYTYISIFSTVNGEKLADSLLRLKNKNRDLFFYFLERRYYPEKIYSNGKLESFNTEDLDCFIVLRSCLETRLNEFEKIKRHNLSENILFIDKLIEKLDRLKQEK